MQQSPGVLERADSLTQAAQADSTSAISEVGERIRSVGQLLIDGEWGAAWQQARAGIADWAVDALPDFMAALFVALVAYTVYRAFFAIVSRALRRTRAGSRGVRDLLLSGLRVAGWAIVILLFLSQVGLDVTTAVAGLGILGLAIGFAAQDSLQNMISGVMIMVDRPFEVGDIVEIEGERGEVIRFTLRSTRIQTLRDRVIVMPNIKMIDQKLVNHSARRWLRVDIPFGIAYKESIAEAREVALATVEGDERILDEPAPEVVTTGLSDSSVDLELRFYIEDAAREPRVRFDYLERVRTALGEADIEIPFPHLQVFIDGAAGLTRDPVPLKLVETSELQHAEK